MRVAADLGTSAKLRTAAGTVGVDGTSDRRVLSTEKRWNGAMLR
jgi:hypothetical protein